MSYNAKQEWELYRDRELAVALPILSRFHIELDKHQPHVGGERYLMQAVTTTSGPKLTLVGKRTTDGMKVVIKVTSNPAGAREIEHERECRKALAHLSFAYQRFFAPKELFVVKENSVVVAVQEYIVQTKTFLERPIEEQFSLSLEGLKIQEGAHATTYGHLQRVAKVFPLWHKAEYLDAATMLLRTIEDTIPGTKAVAWSRRALSALQEEGHYIEQYAGFLTHSDFVPHNIRVKDGALYLLDQSSIRFGNKYEGWARFVNFMTLYNPPLANALITYVKDNRTPEESATLRLMRLYRLIEIVAYYTGTLSRSEGNLHALNTARIDFWTELMRAVLEKQPLPDFVREEYITLRDQLRSPDENIRQIGLH